MRLLLAALALGSTILAAAQTPRIGVVLSGGGAKGAAHVGFLRALEEAGIRVDCIAGTSVGALVGGYYAAGWSPAEMDSLIRSPEFARRASGDLGPSSSFFAPPADPSVVALRLTEEGGPEAQLIRSFPTDWGLVHELSPANAVAEGDFDRLFVPFRCVAADVLEKQDTVFSRGDLAEAVRASMTYPFYLEPIVVDGHPLFDGGLYNNFPSDVLYREFLPDIILGCNVSDNSPLSDAGAASVALELLVTRPSNFSEVCEAMYILRPPLRWSTFDFDDVGTIADVGYAAATVGMDSILLLISAVAGSSWQPDFSAAERRKEFRGRQPAFRVGSFEVIGLDARAQRYAESMLRSGEEAEESLFRLAGDPHLASVRPAARWNPGTGMFDVLVHARPERPFRLAVGGNVSSSPVSMGYVGASYGRFKRLPTTVRASTTFGSLYSAFDAGIRFDLRIPLPLAIEPHFTLHRWNYVRSFATFYQDVRPSYLTMNEQSAGVHVAMPLGAHGAFRLSAAGVRTVDDHYDSGVFFNPADTTDRTRFVGEAFSLGWKHSTLPHKAWNREGRLLEWTVQTFSGEVRSTHRSLSGVARGDTVRVDAVASRFFGAFERYWITGGKSVSWGVKGAWCFSGETDRPTVRGTEVNARPFEPTPGVRSRFLEGYRGRNWVGFGTVLDVRIFEEVRLRGEAHAFYRYEEAWSGPRPELGSMYSAAAVTESPFGPAALVVEWYAGEAEPWLVEFSLGFRLFSPSWRR